MSYTSGNKAPTLMAQAPNRVGNKSKHVPGPGNPCSGKVMVKEAKESKETYGDVDRRRSK